MLDVAAAFRGIHGRTGVRREFLQEFESLIERDAASRRYIEYLAGHLPGGGLAGQKVGLDGIVDVGEIPALLAVPKHRRLLAAQHLRDELRQHARVRRRRILPWSKNVEVAQ